MDNGAPKLLVVADTGLSAGLADYALEVAVRLDLEIIVLFIDGAGSPGDAEQLRRKVEVLEDRVEQEAAAFTSLAWKSSIGVTTIVDVDTRDSAIARIRRQDKSIRFILTAPQNRGRDDEQLQPQLTVIRPD